MNSGFKSLWCMNELDPNEIRLLISNNNSKDYKENLNLNLQKNKIDERFSQKILSKFEISNKKTIKSFKVENKDENEILLLSYLNLFNPKNDSPGLRYDVIDLNISDSTELKTIKSAMNSVKKKAGFFFFFE